MPVITKITQQKRDKERFNIFLDKEYAFSVHESVLVKFELTKGMTVEDWSIEDMVYEDEIQKAFNRALHYLGYRMRSEHEVKQKLLESDYGEAVILEAIVKLRRLGFLDDEKFTRAFVETQINTSGRGPRALQQQLQQKGVPKEIQEKVLADYSQNEQLEVARKMAEKEARRNRTESPRQKETRIQNSLMRKGYSFDIIKEALSFIEFEIDEDEWDEVTSTIGNKAWRRYASRYSDFELHNRVKRSMYQKGIPFEQIDAFIEKKELESND